MRKQVSQPSHNYVLKGSDFYREERDLNVINLLKNSGDLGLKISDSDGKMFLLLLIAKKDKSPLKSINSDGDFGMILYRFPCLFHVL